MGVITVCGMGVCYYCGSNCTHTGTLLLYVYFLC